MTLKETNEVSAMLDTFCGDSIAILKNLAELHSILRLDGWEQDIARIREKIAKLEQTREENKK
jgi:hypothetical protein